MNDLSPIDVSLSIKEDKNSKVSLLATFLNVTDDVYFIDKKIVFFESKYTISCLDITSEKGKVDRKFYMKVKASIYPDDYIKIDANEKLIQSLDLTENFELPIDGTIAIVYSCKNLNHLTGEKDLIESNKLILKV